MARRTTRRAFPTIEAWMRANNVNQGELAKCLAISQSHLCNIIKGNKRPGFLLALKISQLTNVPIETIAETARIA